MNTHNEQKTELRNELQDLITNCEHLYNEYDTARIQVCLNVYVYNVQQSKYRFYSINFFHARFLSLGITARTIRLQHQHGIQLRLQPTHGVLKATKTLPPLNQLIIP